jgi:hypothetical protein
VLNVNLVLPCLYSKNDSQCAQHTECTLLATLCENTIIMITGGEKLESLIEIYLIIFQIIYLNNMCVCMYIYIYI